MTSLVASEIEVWSSQSHQGSLDHLWPGVDIGLHQGMVHSWFIHGFWLGNALFDVFGSQPSTHLLMKSVMVYYAHFDCLLCLWIKTGPTTQSSHEGACLTPQTNTVQLSVRDPHDSVSVCKQGVDHSPLVRFSKMQVGGGAVDIFDGRVVAVMGVWA